MSCVPPLRVSWNRALQRENVNLQQDSEIGLTTERGAQVGKASRRGTLGEETALKGTYRGLSGL